MHGVLLSLLTASFPVCLSLSLSVCLSVSLSLSLSLSLSVSMLYYFYLQFFKTYLHFNYLNLNDFSKILCLYFQQMYLNIPFIKNLFIIRTALMKISTRFESTGKSD
jgi:hypothetical protein